MKLDNYGRGVLLALATAFCWGLVSPIAKILAPAGINLMSVMVFRALFTMIASGIFLVYKNGAGALCIESGYFSFYAVTGALSVAFAGGGFLVSLEYLSVPEALVIHYTFPLIAIIGSLYVTHERPSIFQCVAGVLIVCGVFTGMGGSIDAMLNVPLPGLLWGGVAVIGLAGQALVTRKFSLRHQTDEFKLLFFSNIAGGIILFTYKTLCDGWQDVANLTPRLLSLIIVQAFAASFVAYACFFTALKYIPAAVASLLCTMEIVVAVVLTAVFVHQMPSIHEIIGCGLILIAIACTAVPSRHSR